MLSDLDLRFAMLYYLKLSAYTNLEAMVRHSSRGNLLFKYFLNKDEKKNFVKVKKN